MMIEEGFSLLEIIWELTLLCVVLVCNWLWDYRVGNPDNNQIAYAIIGLIIFILFIGLVFVRNG